MYHHEGFKKNGTIGPGAITIAIPGMTVDVAYRGGTTNVNRRSDVGLLELEVTNTRIDIASPGRIIGDLFEGIGKMLRDEDESTLFRHAGKAGFASLIAGIGTLAADGHQDFSMTGETVPFFYSKTKSGTEIITMPSTNKSADSGFTRNQITLTGYPFGENNDVAKTYGMHAAVVGGRPLVVDRGAITEALHRLPRHVSEVYKTIGDFR